MENKKSAILVLAILAVVVTASGAYAMGRQTSSDVGNSCPSTTYRSGMGPLMMGGSVSYSGGMMGRSAGYAGGMMGGYGMMGTWKGVDSMWEYMWHNWNSTSTP